ncbi:MAG: SRPBCC domain-containing protein, partial [Gammaproteobacteria bacterium]|nr:SRPBCC domain-containing protein [Gammaproteobacteria bacterium]
VHIRYPNAVIASGSVEFVSPPERIVFTYGYEDAQRAMPPGSSRVTVELTASAEGTLLVLTHEFASEQQRKHHDAGWRYQLSVFANVAARTQHAGAAQTLDAWFAAWSETRGAARLEQLGAIADPAIRYRDLFAAIEGIEELDAHVVPRKCICRARS